MIRLNEEKLARLHTADEILEKELLLSAKTPKRIKTLPEVL